MSTIESVEARRDDTAVVVRLPAQDLARARRWYADALGLEPVERRPAGLRYLCGGVVLELSTADQEPGGSAQLSFTVPDLDGAVEGLRERGVEFVGDVTEVRGHDPWTGATGERVTWFRDSEGNLLRLVQPVRG